MAASVPVVLAFSAVLAAVGRNMVVSQAIPTADATQSVILLVGMAVGVDYSLFYLRRTREERAAGRDAHGALLEAAGTSGQAVLISGTTVLIAMAGMLFAGNSIFTSIGIGTMIVVFAAMVGSLTVLPAILHKLGRRRANAADAQPSSRASPTFLAASPSSGTYDRIQRAFPGSQTPAEVVVKADDVTSPAHRDAFAEFQRRAIRTGLLFQPFHVFVNRDRTVARIEFSIAGKGDDKTSFEALSVLRHDVIAPVPATLPGVQVAVTGQTAGHTTSTRR